MSALVNVALQGDVAVVTINYPPVNALGHGVRSGLVTALAAIEKNPAAKATVIHCAGRTFCAGADITEFGKPPQAPLLADVIKAIEHSPKPVVAAIHGTALGGGLELAMACHMRVAVPSARLGLPEVKLGILPGAGGTQRLPRAIGPLKALERIVNGDPMTAADALTDGLIQGIAEGDLLTLAVDLARLAGSSPKKPPLLRDSEGKLAGFRADRSAFDAKAAELLKRRQGQKAPAACVQSVANSFTLPFDEGLAAERKLFLELVAGDQSKALRHVFFAEREAAKIPDIGPDIKQRSIERAAVIGAGTMGGGIAMCFANAGIPVTIIDVTDEALARGRAIIEANYQNTAKRGGLSAADVAKRTGLIKYAAGLPAIEGADIVVEAIFEDMEIKQKLFATLDRLAKPGAVLATNTSTLDIDVIAAGTKRPGDVVGMHFFSPANVMRLLEVVRGKATSREVLATAMTLGRKLGKVPVVSGVCDGFIGNRMLAVRTAQAEKLLLEGAHPASADAALTDFGLAMGHFAMYDLAGLDVGWRIRKARNIVAPVTDVLCREGHFGQKTGKGYYLYDKGSRVPVPDPHVAEIAAAQAQALGIARRTIDRQELVERLTFPMINEAARILEEGIALRPGDIDIVWVYGYGWPAWRGGPMHHADLVGLAHIADRLKAFAAASGDRTLEPAPLLARLAAEGKGFASLSQKAKGTS